MFNGICSLYIFSDMIDNQSMLKWYFVQEDKIHIFFETKYMEVKT